MANLFVIRHGMRIDHEDRSWRKTAVRTFDPPLSANGRQQADQTAALLQQRSGSIAAVYCSPLLRTIQTAHPLAEALDLPLQVEGGLSEWLNPKWHDFSAGMLDLKTLRPDYPRLNLDYRGLIQPRYPEKEEAVCESRCQFVARQLISESGGDIVLVTHGVCVKAIVHTLTDGEAKADERTCVVHVLGRGSKKQWRVLETLTDHLQKQEAEAAYI